MSAHADRLWRERMAVRYLDALDAGDLDAVVALWDEAADDPALLELLTDLNEGLEAEEGLGADLAADADRVRDLARRCLPSAFAAEPPAVAPLTAAEVARRLEAEPSFGRLDAADRAAHTRLLADAGAIPETLGQPQLDHWLSQRGVAAGPVYRRLFRKVAILLEMARGQREARLAAARPAAPPRDPKGGRP